MTVGDTRHTDAGEEEKKKIEGKRKREKEKEAGRWGGTLLFIRVFVASRESERCETSSEPSPRGEILQFKQSKQLFSLMHILVLLQAGSLPTAAAAVAVSVAHLAGRGARGGGEFLTNDLHQYSHIPPKRARETGLSNYFARKTSSR